MSRATSPLPPSATHPLIALSGLAGFLAAFAWLHGHPCRNIELNLLFVLCSTALAAFVPDLLWQRIYRTSLDMTHRDPSWTRATTKFSGLLLTLGLAALGYWLFPEYHGDLYGHYFRILALIMPVWMLLALPYLYWVDARMANPHDGLWAMGKVASLEFSDLSWETHWPLIRQHLLGWLVKAFFLPLMLSYACNDLNRFLNLQFDTLNGFPAVYDFCYSFFYFIDVGMVTMCYLFTLRLTGNHIRSAEPTLIGWMVALICYEPFWSLVGRHYLAYDTGRPWGAWFWNMPLLYGIWGSLILVLTGIYVWATVSFGTRFSNLTHRGIITSGPYRWSKHPAYVAKNLSWWMISLPFMLNHDLLSSLRCCLLLLGLNAIYYARARTEERHLSLDPVYRQYADWVNRHGLFARLRGRSRA